MSHATAVPPLPGLRERKRQATHQRIADEAARLVSEQGVSGTTIEEIAAAADIGRSTFFRYFDTKEIAVAEGFTTPWLKLIVDALDAQPAHLAPVDAIISAFSDFAKVLHDDPAPIMRQAQMSQASPGLQAWTLHLFVRCERAISAAVAPRFRDLVEDDPRPDMVGALAMAAIRNSLQRWLDGEGSEDLAQLIRDALTCVEITPHRTAPTRIEVAL